MTYDVGVMGNGALAGLVAITAGCSTVYPWGAVAIGAVAGCLYVLGSMCSVLLKVLHCTYEVDLLPSLTCTHSAGTCMSGYGSQF